MIVIYKYTYVEHHGCLAADSTTSDELTQLCFSCSERNLNRLVSDRALRGDNKEGASSSIAMVFAMLQSDAFI